MAVSPSTSASRYWFKGQAKPASVPTPHQPQLEPQLDQEVRGADQSVTPADADQVLDHHRLVARGGPQDGGSQARQPLEGGKHPLGRHLGDDDVGDGLGGMIGGSQEDAAQADEVARHADVDHLPAAIGQQLVAAGPALLEDEGTLAGLALMDQLTAGHDRTALRLERGKARRLLGAQRQEPAQLQGEGTLDRCHDSPLADNECGRQHNWRMPHPR